MVREEKKVPWRATRASWMAMDPSMKKEEAAKKKQALYILTRKSWGPSWPRGRACGGRGQAYLLSDSQAHTDMSSCVCLEQKPSAFTAI